MNIILASASPRRKEILQNLGYNFEIIMPDYDENISGLKYSVQTVENCAYNKALDVQKKTDKNNLIISADTVVVVNDYILGKPHDESEAVFMLLELSNTTHFVATSLCLIKNDKILKDTAITKVTFRKLTFDDIENYIKNAKPLDKAGSYGIQDKEFDFAANTIGDIDTVIGFPVALFKKMYEQIS